jgi:hypothetical protein
MYVLERASDVGCCVKPTKNDGGRTKKLRRVQLLGESRGHGACMQPWRGHGVWIAQGRPRVGQLHRECVCPCGGLTLHDFAHGGFLKPDWQGFFEGFQIPVPAGL